MFYQVTGGSGVELFPYSVQINLYPSKLPPPTPQTGDNRVILWKPLNIEGSRPRDNEDSRRRRWLTWLKTGLSVSLKGGTLTYFPCPYLWMPLAKHKVLHATSLSVTSCRKLKDPSLKKINDLSGKPSLIAINLKAGWHSNSKAQQGQSPIHVHRIFNCLFLPHSKIWTTGHLNIACPMKERS